MQSNPNISELFRLANSPAGKQLLSFIQKNGGSELQNAVDLAVSGDYSKAKEAVSSLMSDPQVQQLLKHLEDSYE